MLSCFHLIPNVTDRQTDGQTDGQNCYINIALTRTSAIYLFKLMSFIINIIKFIINILCDSVLLMDLLQSSTRVFVRSVTPEHIVSYVIMKTKKKHHGHRRPSYSTTAAFLFCHSISFTYSAID